MFRALRSRAAVRTLHLLLATPSTFAACGCGGGGGGGTAVAPQNAIALAFPPPHCLTDDPRFELRGTTVRPDRVANITANGFPAASSDRFATWSIDVALGAATTPFDIEAVDGNGARLSSSNCTVEFAALPESPGDIAVDPSRKQILIADFFNPRGLLALDLTTGRTAVASGKDRGIGPPLADGVDAVAVDDANDRAFTLEGNLGQIQSIDLRNGNRTMLSDFLSAGVKFDRPTDLELDVARKRLVVADLGLDALLAVSLTDGSRSILSDATHGSGPALDRPERLALVAGLDVALVITRGSDDLFAVKLSNGDRSIVSGASRGSGPAFRS